MEKHGAVPQHVAQEGLGGGERSTDQGTMLSTAWSFIKDIGFNQKFDRVQPDSWSSKKSLLSQKD